MNTTTRTAQRRTRLSQVIVGVLAGIAGVTGSYAFAGFTPQFVVAPVATFTSQAMPAAIVTFAITTLGEVGDLLNLAMAIALVVVMFTLTSVAALVLGRRVDSTQMSIGIAILLAWLAAVVVTMAVLPSLGAGLGAGLVVAAGELATGGRSSRDRPVDAHRRRILGSVAGTMGVGVVGYVLGSSRASRGTSSLDRGPVDGSDRATDDRSENVGANAGTDVDAATEGSRGGIENLLTLAKDRSLDVDGLDGLVTGKDFYEVDIYNINPNLSAEEWTLSVTGAVENEVDISYDELRKMEAENRFGTLRCVGEHLNGTKIDTALWTGVPIIDIIDRATPRGSTVVLSDGDGYSEEFSVEALRTGLLAYGKDGSTLPRRHGFPVRALIPGHWGEINVKWLTEIEITDAEVTGFWENRGWHGTGPVNTVAKLHATNKLDDGRIQVGGHAYAGTRGIEKVDVSIDGGRTWNEATLSEPLPEEYGTDVWRQWVYEYTPPDGEHEVVVRATDGTGTLQPKEEADAFPNGPSGWVSKTIR